MSLYQQNLTARKLAIVILSFNHWHTVRPVAAHIGTSIDFVQAGQVVRIDVSKLQARD